MKRILAISGVLCALMLFSSSFAVAQGWEVQRLATENELAGAGKVLASGEEVDPLVLDYTEYDPKSRPGIRIREPGWNTTINLSAGEEVYVKAGVHYLVGNNEIIGKVFYEPESTFLLRHGATLRIGSLDGELTQLIGPNDDSYTVGLVVSGGKVQIENAVIIGHTKNIRMRGPSGDLSLDDVELLARRSYFIKGGSSGLEFDYFRDNGRNIQISLFDCVFQGGPQAGPDISAMLSTRDGADLLFYAQNSRFLTPFMLNGTVQPVVFQQVDWTGRNSIKFLDCEFHPSTTMLELGHTPEWLDDYRADGTMVFETTMPNGSERIDWPRLSGIVQGDLNDDGIVQASEVMSLAEWLGSGVDEVLGGRVFDSDKDGTIGPSDFVTSVLGHFGLPVDFRLSEVINDSELLAKARPLVQALSGNTAVQEALMEYPELEALFGTFNATAILEETAAVPSDLALKQNFPNPFNSQTTIRFAIKHGGEVRLTVIDPLGRTVRTLTEGYLEAGVYTEEWDGVDDNGIHVASGIYLYEMRTAQKRLIRKLVLLQ